MAERIVICAGVWCPRTGFEVSEGMVARLDRKRLGHHTFTMKWNWIRGVFDEQTRRKPLVFAADAVRYGI
jgi:hypothetical protein